MLAAIRQAVPEHWILAPGVGAQGADLTALAAELLSLLAALIFG